MYPGEYDPDTLLNLMDVLPEKLQNALTDTLKVFVLQNGDWD